MTTRGFLDAAINAADRDGVFNPAVVSCQFKMTKIQQRAVGANLESMRLVAVGKGRWQLIGVARELAVALSRDNVDRRT